MTRTSTEFQPTDFLGYLNDLHTAHRSQHNRKETSSWVGLAFFSAIALQIPDEVSSIFGWWGPPIVFVIAVVFGLYLRKQLQLQRHVVNVMAACMKLSSNMLAERVNVSRCDMAPREDEPPVKVKDWEILPAIVVNEIIESEKLHLIDRTIQEVILFFILLIIGIMAIVKLTPA